MTPSGLPGADPFGTQALRDRVLAGWAASVSRFREDANAEDDYALTGYHDRLVVELAQNAADAAVRAGVPGSLLLRLRDNVFTAANTGAPLDAAGVESLSTLRASAKRDSDATVGRFGVGFAAVLALSDEPSLVSTTGSVSWSRDRTRELALPVLADEIAARGGSVPVLRLPFVTDGAPPAGYDSAVILPLRDDRAHDLAVRLLAAVDPTLLLTLPALARIDIDLNGVQRTLVAEPGPDGDTVVVDDGNALRWRVTRASGLLPVALLADRPAEERLRTSWQVLWAVCLDAEGHVQSLPVRVPPAVRAPTVTDETLGLPALLSATLPLDPTRRHIAAGALRDTVLGHAAAAYTELVRSLPADVGVLSLVPVGLPLGAVDGVLRHLLAERLPETSFLPAAVDAGLTLRPRDAVVLDLASPALVDVLAEVVPGLLPAPWSGRGAAAALETLGVRRLRLADVVDALGGLRREPTWWHALYGALAEAVPAGRDRDDLGALPVPLADGRLVTGARGLVLAGSAALPVGLERLGVRVVDAEAAHPLLLSLGAVAAAPRELLDDDRLRAAVDDSLDADDPDELAEVVLALVAAAGLSAGDLPWLGRLALTADDGDVVPAEELLLPGGAWAGMVVDDAPFGTVATGLVDRWGAETLVAAGVLDVFATVDDTDVVVDADETDHQLDAEDLWLDAVLDLLPETDLPPTLVELTAVRDLELVRDDAWPQALALLASAAFRGRVVEPAWVLMADGRRVGVPSYTAWWLSRHARVNGRSLGALRLASAGELAGLLDPVGLPLDELFLRAVGVRASLDELLTDPAAADGLLAVMGERASGLDAATLGRVYAGIARHGGPEQPPARLPARVAGATVVVDATTAVVVDAPDLLPLLGSRPVLPVDAASAFDLAEALDVGLASELADFAVAAEPVVTQRWSEVPGVERALQRAGVDEPPTARVLAYQRLLVVGVDGEAVEVPWRAIGTDDHVRAGDIAALGRALAWRTHQWSQRAAMAEALRAGADVGAGALLDAEDTL
ncbi:hypothetical protein acdb102_27630 [Acidothermaceae bacterium B102]|nr:hypothetical protein acdb102_27630 [Acidothermaceae bacterium B102]